MKIYGNEIRPGYVVEHKGGLWAVVKIQHTQPGKGGAYMQVEMKNLRDGTKLNERFRSAEGVERVSLDHKDFQYLFTEGELIALMDTETYEQIAVSKDLVGAPAAYLQDGMTVTVDTYEGEPIAVRLPETVVMVLAETEPTLKGQTAASSYKPARWRTACASWCRRSCRAARKSWSTPPIPPTSSARSRPWHCVPR